MNFIITQNGNVQLGPKPWNKYSFESELEDLGVPTVLPVSNSDFMSISADVKIYPVVIDDAFTINSKIQQPSGPFYNFTADSASGYYIAVDKPIEIVKSELKGIVAGVRYKKEVKGTTAVIQGQTLTIDTMRGTRDVFVQQYLLLDNAATVQWKFPEGWLTLTKSDLGIAVAAGVAHVQDAFVWEAAKVTEIENCTTLAQLDLIDLGNTQAQNGLPV